MSTKRVLTAAEVLAREQSKAKREKLELALAQQLRAHKIEFERQYQFHPMRKWRADFAMLSKSKKGLMVEVQGGIYIGGRHTRGVGIESECVKYAHAIMLGWYVLPVTANQIKSGEAIGWICNILGAQR